MAAPLVPDVESVEFSARIETDSQTPVLSIRVGLSDYFSQASTIQVLFWLVNGRQTWLGIHRDPLTGIFSSDVVLSVSAKSGVYAIRSIRAIDDQGKSIEFSQAQLVELGFDMGLDLINPNSDDIAPEVNSLNIGAIGFDTSGRIHIPVQLRASDLGGDLEADFILELLSPTGASLQQRGQFDADGNAQIDFTLSRFSASGTYRVNTIRLTDDAGNQQMSFVYLAANPCAIEIENPHGDSVAPALATFRPFAIYDRVTHRPLIVLKGSVHEQGSGVAGVNVRMLSPTGIVTDAPWLPYERVGSRKYLFSGEKALSTEFMPGEYAVSYVRLNDAAGNQAYVDPSMTDDRAIRDFVRVYFPATAGQREVDGSAGSDFVFGTDLEDDILHGGLGNDTLYGGAGQDVVDGGEGDDELVGGDGAGDDVYLGAAGSDTVRYTSAVRGITVALTEGTAGGPDIGQDTLWGIEHIIGGQGDDSLAGNDQANSIAGYLGNDTLAGAGGLDTLDGGPGTDVVVFQGERRDYQIIHQPGGRIVITDAVADRDGTDTLNSVELLSFLDGIMPARAELSGISYHWKSHALLSSLSVQMTSTQVAPSGDATVEIRNLRLDVEMGSCIAEVWVTDAGAITDVGLSVSAVGAIAAEFSAAMPTGWQVISNTVRPESISLAGFDAGGTGVNGPVQVGSLRLTYGEPRESVQLEVTEIEVNGLPVGDFSVSVGRSLTNVSGSFVSPVAAGGIRIEAFDGPGNTASAITAADALAALRVAVGLNPNIRTDSEGSDPVVGVSPYQVMAADVDGSGRVTSSDALSILRMAVGLPSSPKAEWLFVEDTRDFWDEAASRFTLTRSSAQWDRAILTDIQGSGETNLVAVLKGDVNGSWAAPPGSMTVDELHPSYFRGLATQLGMVIGSTPITDQWGI